MRCRPAQPLVDILKTALDEICDDLAYVVRIYNDRYGHLEGDNCLKSVAGAIVAAVRRSGDIAAPFGGEEFAIVLPDTDSDTAITIAEKIRSSVRDLGLVHEGSEYGIVTASLGATVFTSDSRVSNPAELIALADLALYQAKMQGETASGFRDWLKSA